jgi:PASTA domain
MVVGVLALVAMTLGSSAAVADSPPLYDGAMTFPSIQGPSGPTEFSWEVHLDEGQALEQVDDRLAGIYYVEGHHLAGTIAAIAAHDAHGTSVPTALGVSAGIFVHHQLGDPTKGGAPFVYPVIAGEGWEGGFVTHHVQMPPPESQPTPLPESQLAKAGCVVPRLKGRTLNGVKRRLRKSNCRIGEVHKRRGATAETGRVVGQSPRPGEFLVLGTRVAVTLSQPSPWPRLAKRD